MANPCPSPGTRFKPGHAGGGYGYPPRRKWFHRMMRDRGVVEEGLTVRESIVKHMIEIATSYRVIVAGKDLELASGRDAVEAAKLLIAYDLGQPTKTPNALDVAEHLRHVAADQWSVLLVAMGEQLRGQSAEKIAEVLGNIMAKADTRPERFLETANEILGLRDESGATVHELAPTHQTAVEALHPSDEPDEKGEQERITDDEHRTGDR